MPDGGGSKLLGTYTGVRLCAFPDTPNGWAGLNAILWSFSLLDLKERVLGVWLFPEDLVDTTGTMMYVSNVNAKYVSLVSYRPTYFGVDAEHGHVPRNKKLLTYPYVYCRMSSGTKHADYVYEKSNVSGQISFRIYGTFSTYPKILVAPMQYDKLDVNIPSSFTETYPQLLAVSDSMVQLLGNNGIVTTLLNVAAMNATGGASAVALNTTSQMVSNQTSVGQSTNLPLLPSGDRYPVVQQPQELKYTVPQKEYPFDLGEKLKGYVADMPRILGTYQFDNFKYLPGDNDAIIGTGNKHYTAMVMAIRQEEAEAIDNFFDMYGYTCQKVKVPNRFVRRSWTYTKTKGCKINPISGGIPSWAVEKIKSIYDNGITFWMPTATILDYTQNNDCVAIG